MATNLQHPRALPPMPAVARILSRFDRAHLSAFMEIAVDLLDVLDGDSDIEANGDELDANGSEEDFIDHSPYAAGPGCPVADPDCAVDDVACDAEEAL